MTLYVEILQLQAKFQAAMVPCSRFIWITNSSGCRRVLTAILLYTKSLPNSLDYKAFYRRIGLGKDFVCKRFTVQTLLWLLEFVIQINLKHNTIADIICPSIVSKFLKEI